MLAKVKNFKLAADKLFLSQPTLSRHIKEMESELDVELFLRSTRQVELTEYGRFLLPYAQRIVDTESAYRTGLAQLRARLMEEDEDRRGSGGSGDGGGSLK